MIRWTLELNANEGTGVRGERHICLSVFRA